MKRHTIEEIVSIIRVIENSGVNISLACERQGITRMTYYRWLKQYRGLAAFRAVRVNRFEAENAQLKILVAEQALEIRQLKKVMAENSKPAIEEGRGGRSSKPPKFRVVES